MNGLSDFTKNAKKQLDFTVIYMYCKIMTLLFMPRIYIVPLRLLLLYAYLTDKSKPYGTLKDKFFIQLVHTSLRKRKRAYNRFKTVTANKIKKKEK